MVLDHSSEIIFLHELAWKLKDLVNMLVWTKLNDRPEILQDNTLYLLMREKRVTWLTENLCYSFQTIFEILKNLIYERELIIDW